MPSCALLCRMIDNSAGKAFSLKQHAYVIAGLCIVILLLFTVGNRANFIEQYYAEGLYPAISWLWHLLFNWLPFSLGDVFYLGIILYAIYFLWQTLRLLITKKFALFGCAILKLIIGLQVFICAFYVLWGMNYFRPPAAQVLKLTDSTYTFNELQTVTKQLIDSTNICRSLLTNADKQQNNAAIYKTAKLAIMYLGTQHKAFHSSFPAAKSSGFTPFINYMGTAGYFNPFSGEAQVNYAMPKVNKPVTACHEMAHQMGFAREDEANFVGFIAGIQSPDRLLRYSAYYLAMQEFMHQVYRQDTVVFHQLKGRVSLQVKRDSKADRLYWQHYQNQIGEITGLFYDRFLKVNNQPEGLRTYNRMIKLTMAYYKQRQKLQQHNLTGSAAK